MNWRITPDTAWLADDLRATVYAFAMPAARPSVLGGSLARIWFAVERGDEPTIAVSAECGLEPEAIRDDVETVLRQLRDLGLIEPRPTEV